jgi:hypothetical protein
MTAQVITEVTNGTQNGLCKETPDVVAKGGVIKKNDWQDDVEARWLQSIQ